MSVDALALGTGFVLGLRHSLDADHLAAVAQFASLDATPKRGLWLGLRWGLGHALALLVIAGLLVPLRFSVEAGQARAAEVLVGLMLIGLAAWRLAALVALEHAHEHRHGDGTVHTHPHSHGRSHVHSHAPTLTGFAHGAAGIVGVLAVLPLSEGGALGRSLVMAAFAAGSVLSMALFGALAGRVYAALDKGPRLVRLAGGFTGVAGLAVGILWVARGLTAP